MGHRPIGSRTCRTQLRVVINKALSPYQPGSRTTPSYQPTRMYALRAIRSCEWGADATSDGFVPICLRLATTSEPNRGIGSANVKRALARLACAKPVVLVIMYFSP